MTNRGVLFRPFPPDVAAGNELSIISLLQIFFPRNIKSMTGNAPNLVSETGR